MQHKSDEALCPLSRCDVQDVLPTIPCGDSASSQRADVLG